jgi:hypothetical protein
MNLIISENKVVIDKDDLKLILHKLIIGLQEIQKSDTQWNYENQIDHYKSAIVKMDEINEGVINLFEDES